MPKRIPIAEAKRVAETHDLRQVLLIGFDGERVHVVTYGKTKADCAAAAKAQEFWQGNIREFSFEGTDDKWVRMPREAGPLMLDSDEFIFAFVRELHMVDGVDGPQGWADFSDEQRDRLRRAYAAMIEKRPQP